MDLLVRWWLNIRGFSYRVEFLSSLSPSNLLECHKLTSSCLSCTIFVCWCPGISGAVEAKSIFKSWLPLFRICIVTYIDTDNLNLFLMFLFQSQNSRTKVYWLPCPALGKASYQESALCHTYISCLLITSSYALFDFLFLGYEARYQGLCPRVVLLLKQKPSQYSSCFSC